MFARGTVAIAAQWSTHSGAWVEIGEVTGGPGGSVDGGAVNGISYDHVLPVEIETPNGLQKLQLGYDDNENHFSAAQRFIDENMLDQNHLRQIADFILARRGQPAAPTLDMTQGAVSGYTSGSSIGAPSTATISDYDYLPVRVFVSFDEVPNVQKILAKVSELNTSIETGHSESTASILTSSNLQSLEDLLVVLADTSHYHSSSVTTQLLGSVVKMAIQWQDDSALFPCFDILRLVANHPSGADALAGDPSCLPVYNKALSILQRDNISGTPQSSLGSPQSLTAMRFLVNCFRHQSLRRRVVQSLEKGSLSMPDLAGALLAQVFSAKKTHRQACSFLILNILNALSSDESTVRLFFPVAVQLLQREMESADTLLKCLLAVGTVLVKSQVSKEPIMTLLGSCDLARALSATKQSWGTSRLAETNVLKCLEEVERLLSPLR